MPLRDYINSDYFLGLFAGVRTATTAPPGAYSPGAGDGTGLPGGIGAGDGGFSTPDDPTVNQPSITYPDTGLLGQLSTVEASDVPADTTATSSGFGSTNGQTHMASRWMIEKMQTDSVSAGFIYDSGADTTLLTSLDMESLDLQMETGYRIRVRHKGSNGGWSPWSVPLVFTTFPCHYTGTVAAYWVASYTPTLAVGPEAACALWPSTAYSYIPGGYSVYDPGTGFCFMYTSGDLYVNGVAVQEHGTMTVTTNNCPDDQPDDFPGTPPPAPAPAPAPAPPPGTPAGFRQFEIDLAHTSVSHAAPCSATDDESGLPQGTRYWSQLTNGYAAGGYIPAWYAVGWATITVAFQNTHPTYTGTVSATMSETPIDPVAAGHLHYSTPAAQSVSIAPGSVGTITWRVYLNPGEMEAVRRSVFGAVEGVGLSYYMDMTSDAGNLRLLLAMSDTCS